MTYSIHIFILACSKNQELKEEFFSEIENKADTDESIMTLTEAEFDWHRLYIIPDWYSENAISEVLGFEWHGPDVEDQDNRFLFLDTTNNSTDFFDYYVNEAKYCFVFCFDVDTIISGCERSYIRKENCVFKSERVDNVAYQFEVTTINCKKYQK